MKVIHLLNWKLENIIKELPNIKNQGFDAIQINPMQPFKEEKIFQWYLSYQPLGFRIGNMFGSKQDLKRLCSESLKYGIDIIVDVVINHTANKGEGYELIPHPSVDKELLNEKSFWKIGKQMIDGDNRFDATHNFIGLPGLNLRNKDLQAIVFNFLKDLKDCGVKGLRFDAAKHIGLYNDGVDFFNNVNIFMQENDMYGYGEFLGGNRKWRDEMAEQIMVLSPSNNRITDLNKFVTFYESHDTFLNDENNTRYLTNKELIYIYKNLRKIFINTLCYVRPIPILKNPYIKNFDQLTFDDVYKLRERDYFDTTFLDSEIIKNINEEKNLKKVI